MKYKSSASAQRPGPFYTNLFDALPGNYLLLQANAPYFTILAATSLRQQVVGMTKEAVIGKPLFEAHPGNRTDPADNGVSNLRLSLEHVIRYKVTHQLPVQRYDLPNADGSFSEKYWRASNSPVFDDEGQVAYIIHTAEDITELVKAEKREVRMEGIEKAFGLFMEAPMVVGLVSGDDYRLEMANKEAFKLWGKGPEMIGMPILQALPELEGQGILELFDQVRTTGQPFIAHEVPVRSVVNGKQEQHYFNLVYQPYYSKNSTVASGVFTISHDVTEQVKARQTAQQSEAKYRTLFESMEQGYCTLEMIMERGKCVDYRYLETNPTFERHLGMSGVLGKTIREIAPDIEEKWFNFYGSVALTGTPIRLEEESKAFKKWFEVYAIRVGDAEERKVGVFFTDITGRKKAEEAIRESETRFRTLADESPMFVFIIDADPLAPVSYWNKTWLTYTGQTYEEALGRAWDGILHADDIPEVMQYYTPAFEKREPYFIPAVRVKGKEGAYRWHAFKGNPRFSPTGEFDGYIGVGFDIHEQKVTEENLEELVAQRTEELLRSNSELRRSNANLEEFAHAASHDLKEPVRKIHFYTNHLKVQLSSQLHEEQKRAFGKIEKATERMGNLIDDLLLYSHVSQRPFEKESIDLNRKVQRVLEDLELDIEERKAAINIGKLPVVKGYPRQLQQLFQNLISNAMKYSKAGTRPQIDICASEAMENGKRYHLIAIKDNGIGFEPEYAHKIFQMFTRLHGKTEYSGTGVGLSIVKKVVENHDGSIRVESTPGIGSTFNVLLPVE